MSKIDILRRSFEDVRNGINAIESAAEAAGRDLTDNEQKDVDALYARAETLKPEIESEGAKHASMSAAADVLARIQPGKVITRSEPQGSDVASIGEYLSLLVRAQSDDSNVRAEATDVLKRAIATQTTGSNALIVPDALVQGSLINFADFNRPVFNSFTSVPMPQAGKQFVRPELYQHVAVAQQVNELDELTSQSMALSGQSVVKKTYGGVLRLSEQDLDWTDPAILQLVINDFTGVYSRVTEKAACDALVASTAFTSAYTATNVGTIVSSLTTAIGSVYNRSFGMPDTLWLDLASALTLAGTTNANTDRSAMSLVKEALAETGMVENFKFVVGPQLPAGTRILGSSKLIESYEQRKGLLTAQAVSILGLDVAYRGYCTFYSKAAGFVKLT